MCPADLCLDVQERVVLLRSVRLQDLRVELPLHAAIDVDRCTSRLRRGALTLSWPALHGQGDRDCLLRRVCTKPLLYVCDGFLTAAECASVVSVARLRGTKRTGLGDYEVKYDMEPEPLKDTTLPAELRDVMESIYERIDAVCGVARHCDEQPPRVHHYAPRASGIAGEQKGRMPMGLHVDSNGRPHRFVTAIVYLTDVPPPGDGATVFPCARDEAVAKVGEEMLRGGTQHSVNLADLDHKPLAAALTEAAEKDRGVSVAPEVGKLAVFFTRNGDGSVDGTSWHGGARVAGSARGEGKWILQFFKEIPRQDRAAGPAAAARFCDARRELPDFTLRGVRHRPVNMEDKEQQEEQLP